MQTTAASHRLQGDGAQQGAPHKVWMHKEWVHGEWDLQRAGCTGQAAPSSLRNKKQRIASRGRMHARTSAASPAQPLPRCGAAHTTKEI
jgi:hypothetical protein